MRLKLKTISALLSLVMVFTFVAPCLETVKADIDSTLSDEVPIYDVDDLYRVFGEFKNVSVNLNLTLVKGMFRAIELPGLVMWI